MTISGTSDRKKQEPLFIGVSLDDMQNKSNRRLQHYGTVGTELNNVPEGKKKVKTSIWPCHLGKETATLPLQDVKPTPATAKVTPEKRHGALSMRSLPFSSLAFCGSAVVSASSRRAESRWPLAIDSWSVRLAASDIPPSMVLAENGQAGSIAPWIWDCTGNKVRKAFEGPAVEEPTWWDSTMRAVDKAAGESWLQMAKESDP